MSLLKRFVDASNRSQGGSGFLRLRVRGCKGNSRCYTLAAFHCEKMCLRDEFQNPMNKLTQTKLAGISKDGAEEL